MLGGTLSSGCARMLLERDPATPARAAKPVFSPEQRELVATASELILPTTDTPGARAAGVHDFIEMMLSDWLEEGEREAFLAGLADLDARSRDRSGVDFARADASTQHEILSDLEKAATERVAGPIAMRRKPPETFFLALKELTVVGYYTSEIGATQELHWQAAPGVWLSCAPLEQLGRSSAGY